MVYGYVRVSTKEQNEDRQLLSFVAENERKNIKQRQKEGIEAAKMRGVRFGRPKAPLPANFGQVYNKWIAKEITGEEAVRQCNITTATFYRRANKVKGKDAVE